MFDYRYTCRVPIERAMAMSGDRREIQEGSGMDGGS